MEGQSFTFEYGQLKGVIDALSSTGKSVTKSSETIRVSPDAGRSSDELAAAFGDLATVVQGLGSSISKLAELADQAGTRYSASDDRARASFAPAARTAGNLPGPLP